MESSLILVLIMASELIAEDSISPVSHEVISREGESVTLSCSYESNTEYVEFSWYRHHPNQAPQFLLYKDARGWSDEHTSDSRYESTTSRSSTELVIKRLTLADTALYYCALRVGDGYSPGGRDKLIFGKAISLTVQFNRSPVTPTLSILRPLGGKSGDPEVCLAAGFYPRLLSMDLTLGNGENVSLSTATAPLSHTTNTYFYAGYSENIINLCRMKDDPKSEVRRPGDEVVTAAPVAVENICEVEAHDSTATHRQTGSKMNFKSLVVYGLRIVFTKAVAFNTLLTVRALVFY